MRIDLTAIRVPLMKMESMKIKCLKARDANDGITISKRVTTDH